MIKELEREQKRKKEAEHKASENPKLVKPKGKTCIFHLSSRIQLQSQIEFQPYMYKQGCIWANGAEKLPRAHFSEKSAPVMAQCFYFGRTF